MNLLLDTHIALWAICDDPKLPDKASSFGTSQGRKLFIPVTRLKTPVLLRKMSDRSVTL